MMHEQLTLLHELQAVEFAALELNLYLDTHPTDQRALMDFNAYACRLKMLKEMYEQQYGPILNFGFSPSRYPWQWIEGPWPWEICY